MQLNPAEISGFIQEKIADYDNKVESKAEGTIISLYDGDYEIGRASCRERV